jgi:hypothetical protein
MHASHVPQAVLPSRTPTRVLLLPCAHKLFLFPNCAQFSKSLRRITSMVSTDAEKITGLSEANLNKLLLDRPPRTPGQDLQGGEQDMRDAEQNRTQPSQNGQEVGNVGRNEIPGLFEKHSAQSVI